MPEALAEAASTNLFNALVTSWPAAEVADIGPWRVRRGWHGGVGVPAATLEGPLGDLDPAIEAMRGWGERPAFMVRNGEAALEATLTERGFIADARTNFYTGPVAGIKHRTTDLTVIDCDGPISILAEMWAEMGLMPSRIAAMAQVDGQKRYLLGRHADRAAGVAFVSITGGIAALNALHVMPYARRRSLGRRLLQWAAAWAETKGAKTLALAVEAENSPAEALCAGLGMMRTGEYHYRVAPDR